MMVQVSPGNMQVVYPGTVSLACVKTLCSFHSNMTAMEGDHAAHNTYDFNI